MYLFGAVSLLSIIYGGIKYFKSKNVNKKVNDSKYNYIIPSDESFILRLAGRSFNRLMNGLNKPFDMLFNDAMLFTAKDLISEFQPSSIITISDEFLLVFPNKTGNKTHPFGGNINKICSAISSFASVRFSHYITDISGEEYKEYFQNINSNYIGPEYTFESNIISIDEDKEITQILEWNSFVDGLRNCINTILKYTCDEDYSKLNTFERLKKIKELDFNFDEIPNYIKYGWLIKQEEVCYIKDNNTFYRRKPVAYSFDIVNTIKNNKDNKSENTYEDGGLFTSKYWNEYLNSYDIQNLDLIKEEEKQIEEEQVEKVESETINENNEMNTSNNENNEEVEIEETIQSNKISKVESSESIKSDENPSNNMVAPICVFYFD